MENGVERAIGLWRCCAARAHRSRRDRRHDRRRSDSGALARNLCRFARRCRQCRRLRRDAGVPARRSGSVGARFECAAGAGAAVCGRACRNRPRSGAHAVVHRDGPDRGVEGGKRRRAVPADRFGCARIMVQASRTRSDDDAATCACGRKIGGDGAAVACRCRTGAQRRHDALVGRKRAFDAASGKRAGLSRVRPVAAAPARAGGRGRVACGLGS